MLRKKPWNRPDIPVYSASTWGVQPNMHICTYVSAVSMQPKRIMVALYHGTLTLANMEKSGELVLQLLSQSQYRLVNLLGKQSGWNVNKIARLEKKGLLLQWEGYPVLKEALAVMRLRSVGEMEGGDHRLYICDVVRWKNLCEGLPLTTHYLGQMGMVRI